MFSTIAFEVTFKKGKGICLYTVFYRYISLFFLWGFGFSSRITYFQPEVFPVIFFFCKADLLATYFLRFCLYRNVFTWLYFQKIFLQYIRFLILVDGFFLSTLWIPYCLLASVVSVETWSVNVIGVLCKWWIIFFFLL